MNYCIALRHYQHLNSHLALQLLTAAVLDLDV